MANGQALGASDIFDFGVAAGLRYGEESHVVPGSAVDAQAGSTKTRVTAQTP
ncbi:MAG TPA: hypothetical protein VLW50_16185 [Streptosporangiaceae bacterium]|nr:hypothetical protein [Streptosporangiaceae bacterium]